MLLLKHVMHRSTLRTFSYILWKRILWIFSVPSLDIADFLPPHSMGRTTCVQI